MVRQHDCCKWPFHPGGNETQKIYQVAGLMTWFGICLTYIRFYQGLKVQGYDRSKMPFAVRFQPFPAWYGMIASLVICFVSFKYSSMLRSRFMSSLVEWMECFPQRQMGTRRLRDELLPFNALPRSLSRRQILLQSALR